MRLLIITSCTGEKAATHEHALTLDDFRGGAKHIRTREKVLKEFLHPAEELYTGQHHVRLMRGVAAFRAAHPPFHERACQVACHRAYREQEAGCGILPLLAKKREIRNLPRKMAG